jgi:hypothetical protein
LLMVYASGMKLLGPEPTYREACTYIFGPIY